VVLADITPSGARLAARSRRGRRGAVRAHRRRRCRQVDALVAQAVARFGRIDCAFNNAGIEEEHLKLADPTRRCTTA
jgi:NAD(P)-dependent dehydrogenase (short-subunit alcohol dehydrogenase family)